MALFIKPKHLSVCAVCNACIRNASHSQHQAACFINHLEQIDSLGLAQCQHDYNHIIRKKDLDDHELRSCDHVRKRIREAATGLVRAIRERRTKDYGAHLNTVKAEQERIRTNIHSGRILVKQLQKQQLREMIEARKKAKDLEKELHDVKGTSWFHGKKRTSTELEEEERRRLYFLKRKKEAEKEATTLNVPPDKIDLHNFLEPSTFNPLFEDLKPTVHFTPKTILVNFHGNETFTPEVEIKREVIDT